MKDEWKQFKETAKTTLSDMKDKIKAIASSTFKVFKIPLVDFVKALFVWIRDLGVGVVVIVWKGGKVILSAFWVVAKVAIVYAYEKVVAWVKKL